MSVSFIYRALLPVILCASWVHSADPVFQPWIPQHLDDWPALVTEAKEYVATTNAAQAATKASIQFNVSVEEQPFEIHGDFPTPPKDMFPGDHISLRFWTAADRTSRKGCGVSTVWRAAKRGAAGAMVCLVLHDEESSWPYPNLSTSAPFFDAQIHAQKPSSGTWKIEDRNVGNDTASTWIASWKRLDDRARTRDDVQGLVQALRAEDLKWLSESPPLAESTTASLVEPAIYQKRVDAHLGIQQALVRFRSGFLARPVIVYKVRRHGLGEKLGIKPGDTPIAVGVSRVTSRADFRLKLNAINNTEQVIQFARLETEPISFTTTSGDLGIDYTDAAPDPGMAVLEVVAKADKSLVADAAVMMYAFDQGDLVTCAITRLNGHIPESAMAFMRAWNAAAVNDIGGVESLLGKNFPNANEDILTEIEDFKKANRTRSGRLLWAWPEKINDPKFDGLLRRIVSPLSIAERFNLFEGKIEDAYFSVAANDQIQPVYQASSLMGASGGVLKTTNKNMTSDASFGNIPDRSQMTFHFTIAPTLAIPSGEGDAVTSPYQFLSVGFETRSARNITSNGMGKIRIHPMAGVSFHCSTIEPADDVTDWHFQPLPIPVFGDGTTINTLRIVRIAQTQRIELNGHLISQGFLPLVENENDESGPKIGIVLSVRDAECRINDVLIKIPKERGDPSKF